MIYNLLLKNKQNMWLDGTTSNSGLHAVSNELANIFKVINQEGDRNIFTQRLIGKNIKNALLKIHTLSELEIDTLMSVIGESNWQQIHTGSHCLNSQD